MASILRKIKNSAKTVTSGAAKLSTVATRASINPLYKVTDKITNKIAPNLPATINNTLTQIYDPLSSTNRNLMTLPTQLNPLDQGKTVIATVTDLALPQSNATTSKGKIPNRAAYAKSASKAGGANAANAAAAAKIEAEKKNYKIPNRAKYSGDAGANQAIANFYKGKAVEQGFGAGRGDAWNNASTEAAVIQAENSKESPTPSQDANNINTQYPDQADLLRYYAELTRLDNMNNPTLPEVVVESDYKKYLIFGAIALLAIIAWKKIK